MDGDKQFLQSPANRVACQVTTRHVSRRMFSVFHLSQQFDRKTLLHHSTGKPFFFFRKYNPKSSLGLKDQQYNRVLASVTASLIPPATCVVSLSKEWKSTVETKCVMAYNLLVCWHLGSAHDLECTDREGNLQALQCVNQGHEQFIMSFHWEDILV